MMKEIVLSANRSYEKQPEPLLDAVKVSGDIDSEHEGSDNDSKDGNVLKIEELLSVLSLTETEKIKNKSIKLKLEKVHRDNLKKDGDDLTTENIKPDVQNDPSNATPTEEGEGITSSFKLDSPPASGEPDSPSENESESETDEEKEKERYLQRGLLTDKSHRYSPFQQFNGKKMRSPGKQLRRMEEQFGPNVFDIIDFQNMSCREEGFSNNWPEVPPSHSSFTYDSSAYEGFGYSKGQMSSTFSPLTYNPCQAITSPKNVFYQPLTPPKSVSPTLREMAQGHHGYGQLEEYNCRKSDDLIDIINVSPTVPNGKAVNRANQTEPFAVPVAEFEKLRHEMDMYLSEEDPILQCENFQTSSTTKIPEAEHDDINYWCPLTPPYSEPPPKGTSPALCDDNNNKEIRSSYNDDYLRDVINGIYEINPDELNVYLDDKKSDSDLSRARNWLQSKCNPTALDQAVRRVTEISTKLLCKKDKDGDTCLMIVYSKPEDSADFYENVFCLQERLREIRLCCDHPLGKAKRCKICGCSDDSKFYTPLSLKNNQGYTALCCAVKTNLSEVMVNYLLDGILRNEEDTRRVFDDFGRRIFAEAACKYSALIGFI